MTDEELIGGDPLHRLQWGDTAGWTVQKEVDSGEWVDIGTYGETPPLAARPFTRWLASQTGLTFDLAEDAVMWLRDQAPSRFIDPFDGVPAMWGTLQAVSTWATDAQVA